MASPKTCDHSPKLRLVVIITDVFTQASIKQAIADGEDEYLDEIYEDMREEAEKFGEVADITIYDLEEPGVVTINFRTAEAAQDCIKVFHGRSYDGRKLKAYTSDGTETFHQSKSLKSGPAAKGKVDASAPGRRTDTARE